MVFDRRTRTRYNNPINLHAIKAGEIMLETIIVLAAILLDQATKIWASVSLTAANPSWPLIPGVFHFTYAKNFGAAFGILQNKQPFFIIVTTVAIIGIILTLVVMRKKSSVLLRIALALFLAGAAGNYFDRIFLGYVRDFLDFTLINFAIFNVADSCVSIGAALIAIDVLILDPKRARALKNAEQAQAASTNDDTAASLPSEYEYESAGSS